MFVLESKYSSFTGRWLYSDSFSQIPGHEDGFEKRASGQAYAKKIEEKYNVKSMGSDTNSWNLSSVVHGFILIMELVRLKAFMNLSSCPFLILTYRY